ncbi:MAG: choice-of-anchor Q domain-containing protein, partial [Saprospiraceae bacterium]
MDGFTITGGYSYGEFFSLTLDGMGAGMLLEGSSAFANSRPRISNCIFEHNACYAGGGLCTTWLNPDDPGMTKHWVNPVLRNCVFNENQAFYWGGAFYVNSPSGNGDTLRIRDCAFTGNYCYSVTGGGGLCFSEITNTNVRLSTCLFERDSAPSGALGGAIYFDNQQQLNASKASLVMDSCIFRKNIAANGAGLFYGGDILHPKSVNFYCRINQCLFEANETNNEGGAAYSMSSAILGGNITVLVTNCAFKDNLSKSSITSVGGYGTGMIDYRVERCTFLNNSYVSNTLSPSHMAISTWATSYFATSRKIHVRINNCIFGKNGGGVSTIDTDQSTAVTEITNCTFFDNSRYIFYKNSLPVSPEGYHNDMYLNNCVIWEPHTDGIRLFRNGNNTLNMYEMYGFHVENTLIEVPDNFYTWPGAQEVFGSGMILNQYPGFVDTTANDFHLLPCSLPVNAGSNIVADTLGLITDLDGHPRIFDGQVDMGAYEG